MRGLIWETKQECSVWERIDDVDQGFLPTVLFSVLCQYLTEH